jgi:hypothetical protein
VVISAKADHSRDEESDANCNDAQVPNCPEVRCVERESCVPKLDEFCHTKLVTNYDAASPLRPTVVSERSEPDIKHDFCGAHSMERLLYQHSVVERQERSEEQDLEDFEI